VLRRTPASSSAVSAAGTGTVRFAGGLAALTYALDLTDGQRPGYTLRSMLLAVGPRVHGGVNREQSNALSGAALLKDAGGSGNAAPMSALFGRHEQELTRNMRLVEWHARRTSAMRTARSAGGDLEQCHRIRRFLMVAQTPTLTHAVNQTRCERGAQIASVLELPATASEAILCVDEQWCGLGYPFGRLELDIPVRSHIARHQRRLKRIGASAAPQRKLRPFARGEVRGSTRRWSPSWSPSIAIMGGGPASPTPNGSGNPWSCWSVVASSWSPRTSGSIALRLRQRSTRSPSAMHDIQSM